MNQSKDKTKREKGHRAIPPIRIRKIHPKMSKAYRILARVAWINYFNNL